MPTLSLLCSKLWHCSFFFIHLIYLFVGCVCEFTASHSFSFISKRNSEEIKMLHRLSLKLLG